MVSFLPFRELIKKRGITTYYLRNKCGEYNLGNKTIDRLMNDQSVSTNTIDALCQILDCEVTDIMEIKRDGGKKPAEGKSMTFSEFAKLLYPYCSNNENDAEFVIALTDQIMSGQPARKHADGTYQNPLRNDSAISLRKYFRGDQNIPRKSASILFRSCDENKFEKFVERQCSDDALQSLSERLKKETGIDSKMFPQRLCSELFERILQDLSQKE